jgi:hypothetical protein
MFGHLRGAIEVSHDRIMDPPACRIRVNSLGGHEDFVKAIRSLRRLKPGGPPKSTGGLPLLGFATEEVGRLVHRPLLLVRVTTQSETSCWLPLRLHGSMHTLPTSLPG